MVKNELQEIKQGQGIKVAPAIHDFALALRQGGVKPKTIRAILSRRFFLDIAESTLRVWKRQGPKLGSKWINYLAEQISSLPVEGIDVYLDRWLILFRLRDTYPHIHDDDVIFLWDMVTEMRETGDDDPYLKSTLHEIVTKWETQAIEMQSRGETPPAFSESVEFKSKNIKPMLERWIDQFGFESVSKSLEEIRRERGIA